MRRSLMLWLAGCAFLVQAGWAPAAENPLAAFPDEAAVVVRFKTPQATIDKAVTFAQKVDPALGPQLRQMSLGVGMLISNPALAGVDRNQDWWLAVFLESGREPGIVFAIPATDAAAMQAAVQGEYQFVEYENWLLYTDEDATAEQLRTHLQTEDAATFASVIDAESRKLFDNGDLSAYLNVPRLREVYRAEIDALKQQIESFFEQASQAGTQVQGVDMAAMFEMYGKLIDYALQALADTEGLVAAASVHEDHVTLDGYIKLTADSPTDKFIQAHPPGEMQRLARLPHGQHLYAGVHGYTDAMMKWGLEFSQSVLKQNDATKQKVAEAVTEYGKLQFGSQLFYLTLGELNTGAVQYGAIVEVAPTDKARELTRQMSELLGSMQFGTLQQQIELVPDAEKIGEHAIDHLKTEQKSEQGDDAPFDAGAIMKILFGPEGMTQRVAYLDGMQVQTLGGGKQLMADTLEALQRDPAAREETPARKAFQAERGELFEKANFLVLLDLPAIAAQAMRLVGESGLFPIPLEVDVELEPSYIGAALTTEPAGVRGRLHVPLAQARGVAQIVQGLLRTFTAPPDDM